MQALGETYQDYKNPFTKKEYEDFARKKVTYLLINSIQISILQMQF